MCDAIDWLSNHNPPAIGSGGSSHPSPLRETKASGVQLHAEDDHFLDDVLQGSIFTESDEWMLKAPTSLQRSKSFLDSGSEIGHISPECLGSHKPVDVVENDLEDLQKDMQDMVLSSDMGRSLVEASLQIALLNAIK